MIKSFTKFTLFSYVLTTWVLPVPALHLEPRGGICNGLTQTRPISGIRACTNPNNVFKYPHLHRTPAALTGVRGAASPSGFVCGKESTIPALHCAHRMSIFRSRPGADPGQQCTECRPLRTSACRPEKANGRTKNSSFEAYNRHCK